MATPLIRLDQIEKWFEGVQALKGVSFDLHSGEVHAVVGENGAGKSTLVKVITGAVAPDAGNIEIGEHSLKHLAPRQALQLGIACIYQQPALFPDLTVAENIAMRLKRPKASRRINWRGQRVLATKLLSRVGAEISVDENVSNLSLPNQQLVEIACALGANARVVIMDEPTASLTRREQDLLFEVVRNLRQQGTGVIYVSHRLDEIFALADRVTILRDGQKVATRATSDLTEHALIHLMVGRELSEKQTNTSSDHTRIMAPVGELNRTQSEIVEEALLTLRKVGCSALGVREIDLELREGEILGLAGLVGAGRTELARIVFGLMPADAGEILVRGQPVTLDSPQTAVSNGIGYVPEDRHRHGIIPELPVEQNITMAIHRRIFPGGWLRRRVERRVASEYIQALDVRPAAPVAPACRFSGGNQQKISVARWLATKPSILILDEPTQGVDVGAKNEIHNLIRTLAENGMGVLLISSDLPELLLLSHRIGVMRAGRLVALLPGRTDPSVVMSAAFGQSTSQ